MTTIDDCGSRGEAILGGLGIRPVVLAQGDTVLGHTHEYDHVCFVARGTMHVHATCATGCNEEYDVSAGSYVLIPATWRHEITALTDVKFWCVFSQHDVSGVRPASFMNDRAEAA